MLPLFLSAAARSAVVVGGGVIGRRKADACADAGLAVRVVDPVAVPWPGVVWIAESYRPAHLVGAALAVAAATPEVNAAVVGDARRASLLVCDAANPDAGDFTFPAVLRRGQLVIAVSTGGASPTLGTRIRDRLQAEYGPDYGVWVAALDEVRHRVRDRVPDAGVRRALLADFADDRWRDRLRDEGIDAVRAEMLAVVEAAAGPV